MPPKAKSTPGDEILAKALKALSANKTDIAVFWLKKWSAGNPGNQAVLRASAEKAFAAREWATAAVYLQPVVEENPTLLDLSALAQLRERLEEPAAALALYERMLTAEPARTAVRIKVSLLRAQCGDTPGALAAFKEIENAGELDPAFVVDLANALWDVAPAQIPELLAVARRLLSPASNVSSPTWSVFLRLCEWQERRARGLPLNNAQALDEYGFPFISAYIKDLYAAAPAPEDKRTARNLATLAFAAGDYERASEAYQQLRAFGVKEVPCAVDLRMAFLESLEGRGLPALLAGFPEVHELKPQDETHANTFFLPCDCGYFRNFGLPLLRSIAAQGAAAGVHLHLFARGADEARAALAAAESVAKISLRVTAEYQDTGRHFTQDADHREYYHAARFLRFAEVLETSRAVLWLMDVDALLHGNPDRAFAALGDAELGMRIRSGRAEPWNVFSACLIAARPTPGTKAYFRVVAAYLAHAMESANLYWGTDQLALFAAYLVLNARGAFPRCAPWPEEIADVLSRPNGVFWFTAGLKKFKYIGNQAAPTSEFEKLFRTFS